MQLRDLGADRGRRRRKGDVLAVRGSPHHGGQRTSDLIPLCHPLALDLVSVDLHCDQARAAVDIESPAKLSARPASRWRR